MCGGDGHASVYLATIPLSGVTIELEPENQGFITIFNDTLFNINSVAGIFQFNVEFGDGSGFASRVPIAIRHIYSMSREYTVYITATYLIGTLEVCLGIIIFNNSINLI